MTDNLRESISALMDNEASEIEVHRVLKEIETDDDVRSTWQRYQLASFALKRQLQEGSPVDISGRIADAIANEAGAGEGAAVAATAQTGWSKFGKSLTSLAVAASVAFMVVFGTMQFQNNGGFDSPAGLAERTSTPQSGATGLPLTGVQTVATNDSDPEILTPSQRRLRELMNKHAQQADLLRGRGVMPYVQMVDMQETRN